MNDPPVPAPHNFEPIVQAVIAAMAAQEAAWRTNWMLAIIILFGAIIISIGIYMIIELNRVKHQTDGILQTLLLATRKLGLAEGEIIGRAAQKTENDFIENKPEVKP